MSRLCTWFRFVSSGAENKAAPLATQEKDEDEVEMDMWDPPQRLGFESVRLGWEM